MGFSSFEADLLSVFLKDKSKYIKFSSRIKAHHFRNDVFKWVYEVINSFYAKFNDLPTLTVFKEELLKTSFSEEKKKQYFLLIKKLFGREIKTPIKYLKESVVKKIEKEELLLAIDLALRNIEKSDLDSAKKSLMKAIILNEETDDENTTIRILRDWKLRQAIRKEFSKIPLSERFVSTPYSVINSVTHGIQISEGATVAGITGMGKSIIAHEFGVNALLDGLNVVHFTLENMAEQTAQRYDSRISEIEYDTIKLYQFSEKQLDHFKKVFKALSSRMKNDVVVKETIKDETDIVFVDKFIETLKLDGFVTNFLIIDSCDLMKSIKKYDSYRLERASIYWDFKFYLKLKRLPGLTTTQLKSSSRYKASTSEDLAEAYDKARILDIVYIMSQSKEQEKDNLVDFTVDKNRDGPKGISVSLYRDLSKMRFLEFIP
jgi:replicative DNA helicase